MQPHEVTSLIIATCRESSFNNFTSKSEHILGQLNSLDRNEVLSHLDSAGIIPEVFKHDSTEEKLFAKYCDGLISRAFNELDFNSKLIEARADSADVYSECHRYTFVSDAKAFRLSRTAKNQKDFKIGALNSWKSSQNADYAALVAPFFQLPTSRSQIYSQAIEYNVTILTYTQLAFLIRNKNFDDSEFETLLETGSSLTPSKEATNYWKTLISVVLKISKKDMADFKEALDKRKEILNEQANEQIGYLEQEKEKVKLLDQKTATSLLIKALKLDSKIDVIKKGFVSE